MNKTAYEKVYPEYSVKVKCVTLNIVFDTIKEACRMKYELGMTGFTPLSVTKCCRGEQKYAGFVYNFKTCEYGGKLKWEYV